jgi:outer membrane protein assembly factor BamB
MTTTRIALCWTLALLVVGCRSRVTQRFEFSSDGPSRTGLVPVEGGVLLGNEGGRALRLSSRGQPVWSIRLEREVAARPAANADTAFFASLAGEWLAVALDTGRERWLRAGLPKVSAPLVASADAVFAVAHDGSLHAVDARTGGTRWSRAAPAPAPVVGRDAGTAPPTENESAPLLLHRDRLVVSLGPLGTGALAPDTGALLWRSAITAPAFLLGREGRVFAAARSGKCVALDATTGALVWSRELGDTVAAMDLQANALVVALDHNLVVGLSLENGETLWKQTLAASPQSAPLAIGALFAVTARGPAGKILWLQGLPGRPVGETRLDSRFVGAPLVVDGAAWFALADGRVVTFTPREGRSPSGQPPSPAPAP